MPNRHMKLMKGTDPTTWPAQIHIKDAYKYIGMSRASWYNTYRKKWKIESMLSEESGPYIPKGTIKVLQDRWIGRTFTPRTPGDQSSRTEYRYVKDVVDTQIRMAVEKALSEAMPAIMAAVMKAVDSDIPYDEFKAHSSSDFFRSDGDPFKKFRDAAREEAERIMPDEPEDHPGQTYLSDQLDEEIPEDLASLARNWESTDD